MKSLKYNTRHVINMTDKNKVLNEQDSQSKCNFTLLMWYSDAQAQSMAEVAQRMA